MAEILNGIEFQNLGEEVLTLMHVPETSTVKVVKAQWSNNDVLFRLQQSPLVSDGRPTFSIDLGRAPSKLESSPGSALMRAASADVRSALAAAALTTVTIATWNSPVIEGIDFPLKFDAICESYAPDMFVLIDVHADTSLGKSFGFFNERGYTAATIVLAAANTGAIWIFSSPESVRFVPSNPTIEAIDARIAISGPIF